MSTEQRYWFPRYEEGKKIIVDRRYGRVYSANPVLIATALELLPLMLVVCGVDYQTISELLEISPTNAATKVGSLRKRNHHYDANLYKKSALELDLLNPLALQ